MSIVVTGGLGYIGSHTCVTLIQAGYDVIVIDNLSNSKIDIQKRIEKITGKPLQLVIANLLDQAQIEQVLVDHQVEAVVHFAGLKAVGESVSHPLMYYRNNLAGTLTLCEAMQKHGVKHMVFSSSATVYGDAAVPIREDAPLSAVNPYGRTKLMIEQLLTDLAKSDAGWSIAMLRYFNPIGAHESGLIGEDPRGVPNNLMPYMTRVAAGQYDELKVFGADYETVDGTGVRDYIHVADLAEGHVKALQHVLQGTGIEAFNLGTGRGYSVFELLTTFERVNQVRIPYRVIERRPGDVAVSFADVSKAAHILQWHAKRGLEEMCRDAWRWQMAAGNT